MGTLMIEVPRESIQKRGGGDGEYGRLVSCSVICEGRVKGLFEWEGRLYAVTGAVWPGLKTGEPPQAFAEQVVPLAEFKGKTFDYDEVAFGDPAHRKGYPVSYCILIVCISTRSSPYGSTQVASNRKPLKQSHL